MRFFCTVLLSSILAGSLAGQTSLTDAQQKFRSELAERVGVLVKQNATAGAGENGWLFFVGERTLPSHRPREGARQQNRAEKSHWS